MLTIVLITVFAFSTPCFAKGKSSSYVNGYYRSSGTYVAPHYRSGKDGYHNNNWSVKGNVNPHTGKSGTKARW